MSITIKSLINKRNWDTEFKYFKEAYRMFWYKARTGWWGLTYKDSDEGDLERR